MSRSDFYAEAYFNQEPKFLCVLVVDVTPHMAGKLIHDLNCGLQSFHKEITEDPVLSERLELSIITFSDVVTITQQPSLVENFVMPKLMVQNGLPVLSDALTVAFNVVADRKTWYKQTNQPYYRPWVILLTDGVCSESPKAGLLLDKLRHDKEQKKYHLFPIGVGEYIEEEFLGQIDGTTPLLKIGDGKIPFFFEWLANSIRRCICDGIDCTKNALERTVNISSGVETWIEEI